MATWSNMLYYPEDEDLVMNMSHESPLPELKTLNTSKANLTSKTPVVVKSTPSKASGTSSTVKSYPVNSTPIKSTSEISIRKTPTNMFATSTKAEICIPATLIFIDEEDGKMKTQMTNKCVSSSAIGFGISQTISQTISETNKELEEPERVETTRPENIVAEEVTNSNFNLEQISNHKERKLKRKLEKKLKKKIELKIELPEKLVRDIEC